MTQKGNNEIRITLRLPRDTHDLLRHMAIDTRTNVNLIIVKAIKEFYDI
jgi:uncharacterized protein (DUF1778 family)